MEKKRVGEGGVTLLQKDLCDVPNYPVCIKSPSGYKNVAWYYQTTDGHLFQHGEIVNFTIWYAIEVAQFNRCLLKL